MNPFTEGKEHIKNGWCQRMSRDASGNVCASGALQLACGMDFNHKFAHSIPMPTSTTTEALDKHREAMAFMTDIAAEMFPDRVCSPNWGRSIVSVNDHPETTAVDILSIFEKAEVKWEEMV